MLDSVGIEWPTMNFKSSRVAGQRECVVLIVDNNTGKIVLVKVVTIVA